MKLKHSIQMLDSLIKSILGIFLISLLVSCGTSENQQESDVAAEEEQAPEQYVVNVVTTALDFQLPDEIPSGWITFRYKNQSTMTHFFILEKMPEFEGRQLTVEDHRTEIVPVFQEVMNALISGEEPPYDQIPEWFSSVQFVGGPGLIGSGGIAQTTLKVEPGTYVMECYVKNPGGQFHSSAGMTKGLVVTDSTVSASPPEASIQMTLSSERGIEVPDGITTGEHTVSAYFEDQKVQEHFAGFDVHLVRLPDTAMVAQVGEWMNWMLPMGLQIPAPVEFLGGTQEMPAGNTVYFNVYLQPGTYAWVSEIPDPAAKNMLKIFTVTESAPSE